MSSKTIDNMCLDLVVKITRLCQKLGDERRRDIVVERLLDSCVTVGVSMHDYEYANTNDEAKQSLNLALSELKRTSYWSDLMYETGIITYEVYDELCGEFTDLSNGIKEMIELMNFSKS